MNAKWVLEWWIGGRRRTERKIFLGFFEFFWVFFGIFWAFGAFLGFFGVFFKV